VSESESDSVVVDAGAIYVLLMDPAQRGERVAERVAGRDIAAPALLPFEVTNVLRRQWSAGIVSRSEALSALADLRALAVDLWPFEALEDRIWELGGALSAYDASYVALAELLGAPLLTTDARLRRSNEPRCPIEVV
jgi:predicted nucleic acid-binding protein